MKADTDEACYRKRLESQIRDEYGRLVYTYTSHLKMRKILKSKQGRFTMVQICISAVMTGGLLSNTFLNEWLIGAIGALLSTIILVINAYLKQADFATREALHGRVADELWLIKEKYVSLLAEFSQLEVGEMAIRRDDLLRAQDKIYRIQPMTNDKAYKMARRALKEEDEQFFSDYEIDKMLPKEFRLNDCE